MINFKTVGIHQVKCVCVKTGRPQAFCQPEGPAVDNVTMIKRSVTPGWHLIDSWPTLLFRMIVGWGDRSKGCKIMKDPRHEEPPWLPLLHPAWECLLQRIHTTLRMSEPIKSEHFCVQCAWDADQVIDAEQKSFNTPAAVRVSPGRDGQVTPHQLWEKL